MNNIKKRIIAREFLTLMFGLIISLLFTLGIFSYSVFNEHKKNNLKTTIDKTNVIVDSLKKTIDNKLSNQKMLYETLKKNDNRVGFDANDLWEHLSSRPNDDTIVKIIFRFTKKSFKDIDTLKSFIKSNILNKEENKTLKKINSIELELISKENQIDDLRTRIYSKNELIKEFYIILTYSYILLFPIRWIIYMIIWSIKVLKDDQIE